MDREFGSGCATWPNLHTLMLRSAVHDPSVLREFVEHRVRVNKPLRTLVLAHSIKDTGFFEALQIPMPDVRFMKESEAEVQDAIYGPGTWYECRPSCDE